MDLQGKNSSTWRSVADPFKPLKTHGKERRGTGRGQDLVISPFGKSAFGGSWPASIATFYGVLTNTQIEFPRGGSCTDFLFGKEGAS
jgi:hypothetical protein